MEKLDKEKLREAAEMFAKNLPPIMELLSHYYTMEQRTPEEDAQLMQLLNEVKPLLSIADKVASLLGEEGYAQAVSFYYNVKEQAERGNPRAAEILNDLAPQFRESLREQTEGE